MPFKLRLSLNRRETVWFKHLFPTLVFAIFMVAIYSKSQWDITLTNLFFDAQQHVFPLKRHYFLSQWMHTDLKWLMVTIALASLVLSAASYKLSKLKAHRKSLLWVFVGMVVATAAVSILKHYSQHGCPWDLAMYGGDLPLFELFATQPAGVEAGHCLPAGHPSGGFALMAFYFAFMHSKPRFANNMLWLGLVMGLLMGMAQVMRGAHFLSHVLWSGWVVWVVLLILYWIWPPHKALPT
jgi:membrane-associated PAP2 superfamily phosphatase